MSKLVILGLILSTLGVSPAMAAKCYAEHECGACKNCNYCKNCNSGGELCGVYYQSREVKRRPGQREMFIKFRPSTKRLLECFRRIQSVALKNYGSCCFTNYKIGCSELIVSRPWLQKVHSLFGEDTLLARSSVLDSNLVTCTIRA